MLETITISNFAIIDNLSLNFQPGMTALTGETGAGKSIIIDALQYALGARTDASMVRHGCARADISAEFKIKTLPAALIWLETQSLDDGESCLLKRSILADGGSKQFINGQPCTQTQMRELASLLVTIHGQHDNHLLAQKNHQQILLDQFAQSLSISSKKSIQHAELLAEVENTYEHWSATQAKILAIQSNTQDFSAKVDLLNYQIQELEKLNLGADELKNLEQEHKLLIKFDDLARLSYSKHNFKW